MKNRLGLPLATFFFIASWSFIDRSLAQEPVAVPVGSGSYASFPPAQEDENRNGDKVADMATMPLALDPSTLGKPIPTNQWWTNLLTHPFNGTLWPYPLAARTETSGVKVFFPKEWNDEGTEMKVDHPLAIRADVGAANGRPDVVIADFEGPVFPKGWQTSGEAFGNHPEAGAVEGQTAVPPYQGHGLANSCHGGDGTTGELNSPVFKIERQRIQFLVGGGKNQDEVSVRLMVDGKQARIAAGDDLERPKVVSWDVREFAGHQAKLMIIDDATGGWGHIIADNFIQTDLEPPVQGAPNDATTSFQARAANALRWGDWSLTFRMPGKTADQFIDFTLGRGMPFCWAEFHGLSAVVETFDGAQFAMANGQPAHFPVTTDRLVVNVGPSHFVIFVPADTGIGLDGTKLRFQFGPQSKHLVSVAALADGTSADSLAPFALNPPLDTRLSWTYDPAGAQVHTHWTITPSLPNVPSLQGWLPHHYRQATTVSKLTGPTYATPRGIMRSSVGNVFDFAYRFDGMVPTVPAPSDHFDVNRMKGYLEKFSDGWKYGGDTYWGGKDLLRAGQGIAIARAIGDVSMVTTLKDKLHGAMVDWFTYTPGETEHYFARYDRWKAMVGFNDSYNSFQFTDNHFHYGYFTTACALLALEDHDFLKEYGPMATLVARQYANWDRSNPDFPFLRTFDVWEGHSHAGGFGSGNGNNQESSSEAMQSWGGLFLLGCALGNDGMRDAGAMGYSMERASGLEYWFNYSAWKDGAAASNWPSCYPHKMGGIIFTSGQAFATYFSGDPGWIYGIQWLPVSPLLDYLSMDPKFAAWSYEQMLRERAEWQVGDNQRRQKEATEQGHDFTPGENTITSMGSALGNVILGYQLQFDPAAAAATLDQLFAANDDVGTDPNGATVNYYLAHANMALGPRQWNWHASIPTATVYLNPVTKVTTYTAVNFSAQPVNVVFNEGGIPKGLLTVSPVSSASSQSLVPLPK